MRCHYTSSSGVTAKCILHALLVALVFIQLANASPGTLASCQQLQERIDHYSKLKRVGGSAKQMARWHSIRNKYKQRFRDKQCNKYRSQIN